MQLILIIPYNYRLPKLSAFLWSFSFLANIDIVTFRLASSVFFVFFMSMGDGDSKRYIATGNKMRNKIKLDNVLNKY